MATTYVTFLRAINTPRRTVNVPRHTLKMAVLAEHFYKLGFDSPKPFLDSGNVIFRSSMPDASAVTQLLNEQLESLLKFKTEVFTRSATELRDIEKRARQHRLSVPSEGEVTVAFLAQPLSDAELAQLAQFTQFKHLALWSQVLSTDEYLLAEGTELYWLNFRKQSDYKIFNSKWERKLKVSLTLRSADMLRELVDSLGAQV